MDFTKEEILKLYNVLLEQKENGKEVIYDFNKIERIVQEINKPEVEDLFFMFYNSWEVHTRYENMFKFKSLVEFRNYDKYDDENGLLITNINKLDHKGDFSPYYFYERLLISFNDFILEGEIDYGREVLLDCHIKEETDDYILFKIKYDKSKSYFSLKQEFQKEERKALFYLFKTPTMKYYYNQIQIKKEQERNGFMNFKTDYIELDQESINENEKYTVHPQIMIYALSRQSYCIWGYIQDSKGEYVSTVYLDVINENTKNYIEKELITNEENLINNNLIIEITNMIITESEKKLSQTFNKDNLNVFVDSVSNCLKTYNDFILCEDNQVSLYVSQDS